MSQSDSSPPAKTSRFPLPKGLEGAPLIYSGFRFDVCTAQVPLESGGTAERQVVVHPGAVAILPLIEKDKLVLIRNRRHAVGERLWEVPAGTLEPGEEPIETARREVIEETGYKANTMEPLVDFYTTPGFCTEKMHVFVGRDLEHVGQNLDDTEEIEVHIFAWDKVKEMLRKGAISDGKTMLTLLYYQMYRVEGVSP